MDITYKNISFIGANPGGAILICSNATGIRASMMIINIIINIFSIYLLL